VSLEALELATGRRIAGWPLAFPDREIIGHAGILADLPCCAGPKWQTVIRTASIRSAAAHRTCSRRARSAALSPPSG